MERQVHVFDIDGTVTTCDGLLKDLGKYLNRDIKLSDLVRYSLSESMYLMGHIGDKNELDEADFFSNHADNYFTNSPSHEGVLDYIEELKHDGHDVWFLTARKPVDEPKTVELFGRLGLDYNNVIHASSAGNKLTYLTQLGATHFYEDKPETIFGTVTDLPFIKVYCVPYPYNVYVHALYNVTVVHDWKSLRSRR